MLQLEIDEDIKLSLVVFGDKKHNYSHLNDERIIFIPTTYNTVKLVEYYRSVDIFVHSSNIETWGLTVSEALSMGLPVVASNVGGIKDQVKGYNYNDKNHQHIQINQYDLKEANGILFNRADSNGLFSALLYLIHNKNIRIKLGQNARQYAIRKLDSTVHIKSLIDLCETVDN